MTSEPLARSVASRARPARVLVALGCALAALLAVARAHAQIDPARAHFRRGVALYDAGDATAALAEFRRALDLRDSPNARLYLARALRDSGMLVEAVEAFEATAQQATAQAAREPRYAPTAAAALAELPAVERAVGRVVVAPPPGAGEYVVSVAGRAVPVTRAASEGVAVMPGRVAVVISAPDAREDRRDVEVRAGERVRIEPVALVPAASPTASPAPVASPTAPSPVSVSVPAAAAAVSTATSSAAATTPRSAATSSPTTRRRRATGPRRPRGDNDGSAEATVAWLSGAAGVAAMVFGGIGLYTANQTQHAIESGCLTNGRCAALNPATATADAQRLATASTATLIGGGLALGVGLFVGVLGAARGASPERAAIRVAFAPDGVAVTGRF